MNLDGNEIGPAAARRIIESFAQLSSPPYLTLTGLHCPLSHFVLNQKAI